jgi:LysM repeat protein
MPIYRLRKFITLVLFTLLVASPALAQEETYVVQRGDNLYRIALRFGITTQSLAEANGITDPSRIFAGQQLIIPGFDTTPAVVENPLVGGTPTTHTVAPGESLLSIANQYGMTVEQILEINNIPNPNLIHRGEQIIVWANIPTGDPNEPTTIINVSEPIVSAPVEAAPVEVVPADNNYTVQPGEHLAEIARRFGVNWTMIAEANSLTDPNQIYAGQVLTIPSSNLVSDLGILEAPVVNAPPPTIFTGKQIVVDLSDQMLYAYQDGNLVRSVLVSTGLPGTPTVLGDYNVYVKYGAQTMSGPGYYLPDVPYVMYFYRGYALHGTYWHNNFGQPMSHGCVNLPTPESEWLFNNFVEVGTPVHVQL